MNYDQTSIPAAYDRGRDLPPETLQLWLDLVAEHQPVLGVATILDLGCGTGRFSEGLARRFAAEVVAIDPSSRMLEQARAKQQDARVRFQRARAEQIPLAENSVDLVFLSMSFHHFADVPAALGECRRVLCDRGSVFVRTGTREQIPKYAYTPFFPASVALMETHLPDSAGLRRAFQDAGFQERASVLVTQTVATDWASYVERIAAGADSILARLDPGDFENGLQAMRDAIAARAGSVTEPIDLLVFD